jgi:hypothetical protein
MDSRRDRFSNVTLPNKKEIGISRASSNGSAAAVPFRKTAPARAPSGAS